MLRAVVPFVVLGICASYAPKAPRPAAKEPSRRDVVGGALLLNVWAATSMLPAGASAKVIAEEDFVMDTYRRLEKGQRQLRYLLDNWEKLTEDCRYGEVKKGLLSNKTAVLEAAGELGT